MLSLAARWLRGPGRRLTVAREGKWVIGITVGVGLAAINTGNNLLFLVWGMLLSSVMLSGVLSEAALRGLRRRWIRVNDGVADAITKIRIEITNENRFWTSYAVQVGSLWHDEAGAEHSFWGPFWVEVAPGETRIAEIKAVFPHRGKWVLKELHYRTTYPFSFFEKLRFRSINDYSIWIGPSIIESEILIDQVRDVGQTTEFQDAGNFGDIRGIRPYRNGDSLGLIHWLTTTRHQTWMSKELEESKGISVSLRWAPEASAGEELERELIQLHSLVYVLLKRKIRVFLELENELSLELFGAPGSKRVNLALAQFGYLEFGSRVIPRDRAICLGAAKPRSSLDRTTHFKDIEIGGNRL